MLFVASRLLGFSFLTKFIKSLNRSFEKKSISRETYNQLNNLSDKELLDIGISRSDIRAISKEVFYDDRTI